MSYDIESLPERIETKRLILSRPKAEDMEEMFARYSACDEVTRYLGWPKHRSLADAYDFLTLSDFEWRCWPCGPYLMRDTKSKKLLGSTGLAFENSRQAMVGYLLARDSWGMGFATEALKALIALSKKARLRRLDAFCLPEHQASRHVLEKCSFEFEGVRSAYTELPNLAPQTLFDVVCYFLTFEDADKG